MILSKIIHKSIIGSNRVHIYEDGERRMFHNRGTAGQLLPLLPLHRSSRGKGSFRNFSLQQMREIIQRRAERERERERERVVSLSESLHTWPLTPFQGVAPDATRKEHEQVM